MSVFVHSLIIYFLIALCTLNAKPESERVDLYYGVAKGDYLIGNLQGAVKGIEQVLKLDPDYIPALVLNAQIQIDQGSPESALQSVERVIELEPQNLEHLLLKAIVLVNMDQKDNAIHIVQEIKQSTSASNEERQMAGKLLELLLMAQSDWDLVTEIFNQNASDNLEAKTINPELAMEDCLNRANNALLQNDFDTALGAIEKVLGWCDQLSNSSCLKECNNLRMLRIHILTQSGRVNEAIESLQAIAGEQPENFETLVTLASLYASLERWESLQEILKSIAVNPQLQDIVFYLEGRIALAKGRIGTAREKFEAALRILPDQSKKLRASIEFYQAVCFEKVGRLEECDATIIRSLNNGFQPETVEETMVTCRSLMRSGENSRAITLLEGLVLNPVPLPPEFWNMLGRAHMANGSKTLALSAFNQSLRIRPDQVEILALRGSLLRAIGDLEGAAADMENALTVGSENASISYSLGLTYFQMGDLISAKQLLGQSAQQVPDNLGIQLLYSLLAYNTGADKDAQSALETYLANVTALKANESAFYLEYVLIAEKNLQQAIEKLDQRTQSINAAPMLENFLAYAQGKLDRKAVLDAAGHAESPELARKQLCEAAYWLAQHERVRGHTKEATELLELATQIGSKDYSEYLFAQWLLKSQI